MPDQLFVVFGNGGGLFLQECAHFGDSFALFVSASVVHLILLLLFTLLFCKMARKVSFLIVDGGDHNVLDVAFQDFPGIADSEHEAFYYRMSFRQERNEKLKSWQQRIRVMHVLISRTIHVDC